MTIQDLDDLRADMQRQAEEMRLEAARLVPDRPEEAANLNKIADRLVVYMRDYLRP
jgi:hypothetical protein